MAKKHNYQPLKRLVPRQYNFLFLLHEKRELETHYDFLKCQIITPSNGKRLLKAIGHYNQTGVEYVYEVTYDGFNEPNVIIISPSLVKNPPHVYSNDGSLCLFYPKEQPWSNRNCSVFSHTIPWTHEWILFYEIWKITGTWEHPEVSHGTISK